MHWIAISMMWTAALHARAEAPVVYEVSTATLEGTEEPLGTQEVSTSDKGGKLRIDSTAKYGVGEAASTMHLIAEISRSGDLQRVSLDDRVNNSSSRRVITRQGGALLETGDGSKPQKRARKPGEGPFVYVSPEHAATWSWMCRAAGKKDQNYTNANGTRVVLHPVLPADSEGFVVVRATFGELNVAMVCRKGELLGFQATNKQRRATIAVRRGQTEVRAKLPGAD